MLKCDRNFRSRLNKEIVRNRGQVLWVSCFLQEQHDGEGNKRLHKVRVQGTYVNPHRKVMKLGKATKKAFKKYKLKVRLGLV